MALLESLLLKYCVVNVGLNCEPKLMFRTAFVLMEIFGCMLAFTNTQAKPQEPFVILNYE
ncbi:hypothetical protein OUZ56_010131 [Daphnia magna]|uniref:Uncharacterized protein n=1 Tax=Daphnia magna TaxID=35525 RepID=A0ABR0AHV4_9CRUS|nr:hypothetical protein OUZ56_010131 [Daphnia magna]